MSKDLGRERPMRFNGTKPGTKIGPRRLTELMLDGILGIKPVLTRITSVEIWRNPLV
jgi:hypothetical protein